jgi:hypothetical protein
MQSDGGRIVVESVQSAHSVDMIQERLIQIPEQQVTIVSEAAQGPAGVGVPAGGAPGDVLSKNTATNFDAAWSKVNLTSQVEGRLPLANILSVSSKCFMGRQASGIGDIEALLPAQAREILGFQHGLSTAGENSITQSIAASSSFLQIIPLSNSDWTHGIMMVRDAGSGINAGAVLIFSTETNKSAGLCGTALTYVGNTPWSAGGRVRLANFDGFITDTIFFNGTGGYDIRINSARINGNQIEISWFNTAVISRTLSARMRWYVWRGDQVNA